MAGDTLKIDTERGLNAWLKAIVWTNKDRISVTEIIAHATLYGFF